MKKTYNIVERKLVAANEEPCAVTVFAQPDESDKRYLVDELKIDEHTFSSALDPDELSRLEFEPEHVALIFKRPKNYSGAEQFLFKVTSAGAFLFKDRLRIVAADDSVFSPSASAAQCAQVHGFQQRVAGQAVGAVQAGAGHLADGVAGPAARAAGQSIGDHAAAEVVRGGHDRDRLARVDADQFQAACA